MKTVLIMRHAKSDWGNAALSDHDRPLNGRGHADAPKMGKLLKQEELTPDLIISSSAKRAWQTAEGVAYACGYENEIEQTEEFYLAEPESYLERLSAVENHHQIVMVVGHNSGISELVSEVTNSYQQMTTANIAQVQFEIDNWAEIDNEETVGRMMAFWRPKDL